jgi:hypothetical protein
MSSWDRDMLGSRSGRGRVCRYLHYSIVHAWRFCGQTKSTRIFSAVCPILSLSSNRSSAVCLADFARDCVFLVSDHVHRFMFFVFLFFLSVDRSHQVVPVPLLAYSRSFCFLPLSFAQYVPTPLPFAFRIPKPDIICIIRHPNRHI